MLCRPLSRPFCSSSSSSSSCSSVRTRRSCIVSSSSTSTSGRTRWRACLPTCRRSTHQCRRLYRQAVRREIATACGTRTSSFRCLVRPPQPVIVSQYKQASVPSQQYAVVSCSCSVSVPCQALVCCQATLCCHYSAVSWHVVTHSVAKCFAWRRGTQPSSLGKRSCSCGSALRCHRHSGAGRIGRQAYDAAGQRVQHRALRRAVAATAAVAGARQPASGDPQRRWWQHAVLRQPHAPGQRPGAPGQLLVAAANACYGAGASRPFRLPGTMLSTRTTHVAPMLRTCSGNAASGCWTDAIWSGHLVNEPAFTVLRHVALHPFPAAHAKWEVV